MKTTCLIIALCGLMFVSSCKNPATPSKEPVITADSVLRYEVTSDTTTPIVKDSFDYGRSDYLPLAVGNTWNYSWSISFVERTPNGQTSGSYGGKEKWEVVSYQKLNDTTGIFKLVITGNKNSNIVTTQSFDITRGTIRLQGFYQVPVVRTGTEATISTWYSEGGGVAGYQAIFSKGIGKTRESKHEYVHVLAGLQREFDYLTILTSYSLKP